jgi:hypothetical protein
MILLVLDEGLESFFCDFVEFDCLRDHGFWFDFAYFEENDKWRQRYGAKETCHQQGERYIPVEMALITASKSPSANVAL